jgi:hypothetical protein
MLLKKQYIVKEVAIKNNRLVSAIENTVKILSSKILSLFAV